MSETYGRNSAQVEWLLAKLGELPVTAWRSLEDAHARAQTLDAAEDALANVLSESGLRQTWFALRARATSIAKKAAADYALETGETKRTIEHPAAVNAWDGQRESSSLEILGPAHERGFIDGACGALGVVLMRPYITDKDFERFWRPYEPVIGL